MVLNGNYTLRATVNVIAYNTKLVPAAEAPKGWKDLLDPKWRGRMVTAHPGYSGVISTHVLALVQLYGWDYFKQLAQNKLMLVQSAVDPAGVVASGERQVAVNGGDYYYYYYYYSDEKEGEPDRGRLSEGRRSPRRVPDGHRRLRAASECGQALHRLHLQPRVAAGDGGQRGPLHRPSRGEVPRRQAEVLRAQAPHGGSGRAREAERRDQESL